MPRPGHFCLRWYPFKRQGVLWRSPWVSRGFVKCALRSQALLPYCAFFLFHLSKLKLSTKFLHSWVSESTSQKTQLYPCPIPPSLLFLCVSLSVSLCVSVSVSLCVYVCLSVCLSLCFSVCMCVSLSVYLCVCLSLSLSVCIWPCPFTNSTWQVHQERLSPTSERLHFLKPCQEGRFWETPYGHTFSFIL